MFKNTGVVFLLILGQITVLGKNSTSNLCTRSELVPPISISKFTNVGDSVKKKLEEIHVKLTKDQMNLAIKVKNETLQMAFILGICFLLIISTIIFFAYRYQSRLNQVLTLQKEAIQRKNEQIANSLRDKEILLKEVHHRVKNNLQIISSLLNLQARNVTDVNSLNAIEEGQERIQAIALIHQQLYQGSDISKISIENYLKELSAQLLYSHTTPSSPIEINIKAEGIMINLDTSVPLGLIANELFTNAYKHAFYKKIEAKILVNIAQVENENKYLLSFEDNGKGLPDNFSWDSDETLGVEIINALVGQLDGKISFETGDWGTRFNVTFSQI
jgi:two-component system, sensor histidine kinase PdtaS